MDNKAIYYMNKHRVMNMRKQKRLAEQDGLKIYESALSNLYNDGFFIEESGTQYIAKLIEQLIYEREFLKKYCNRKSYEGYWDLEDKNNPHYAELGNGKKILRQIRKSIIHSYFEDDDISINDLIYHFADQDILYYYYLYKDDPEYSSDKAISYNKLLKNK